MKLASQGDHEAALAMLKAASQLDPGNSEYRIDMLSETGRFAADLIARADAARRTGNSLEAGNLYARALKVEPANEKARRGLNSLELDVRNGKLLSDAEALLREGRTEAARDKVTTELTNDPSNAAAMKLSATINEQIEKTREIKAAQSAAQSVMNKPVTLQFRDANLRMVFEALSRTTGLNVILDRDVRADLKTTIFVKDAAVEDTVDLILLQNQLERRTLNANTLFVYPATAAKQKEYQDLQVRTFQIANGDAKYLQSVLKSLLKLKEVTVDERANTLAVRDTPDAVAVAAKVIAAHDVPDPEVMLEVEVLEISRSRASNIGLQLPSSFSVATPSSAATIGA
ncbi:MAG: secretin N-terminal domain-containing protein, partial [Rhizobacter sp.]